MKYTALVPVKSLEEVKSRLATHLTQAQRVSLVFDMLHHILCVLTASNELDHVSVVSADSRVLEYAQACGARPLREEQAGHNPALTAAAVREIAGGTTALLTISADLPLLQQADLHVLIELSHRHDVVLAASQDGTGTNALLVHPPLAVPYVFGPGSLQLYQAAAEQRHLSSAVYTGIGSALDIDTIHDLDAFHQYERTLQAERIAPCP